MGMKFRTFCVLIVVLTFCMSGCAMYGNEKQYDKGEWYLWASSAEVARKKQDELALEKVRLQEGKTGRKPCARHSPSSP